MRKFRVFRGAMCGDKMMGCGLLYNAVDAKDAVRQDEQHTREIFGNPGPLNIFAGTKPHPIVHVHEMVLVPESEWK